MVRGLVDDLMASVLPVRCARCGARGALMCAVCAATVPRAPAAPPPPGIDWWVSWLAYEGVAREVIARAKYRSNRAALYDLARHLASIVETHAPSRADVVTWAPASRVRYARTGVDHASVIARAIARELNMPSRALLRRADANSQTGKDARSRRAGPRLVPSRTPSGLAVLVIDDVTTTGGTLAAVARVLREGGARRVFAATIARTPRPGGRADIPAYTPATTPE
jgi:predicted amidophosphoribosyltransferase